MAAPKYKPSFYEKLYSEGAESKNLQDKKMIEALKERLNNKILKDENVAKKAALILEQWINKKTKP